MHFNWLSTNVHTFFEQHQKVARTWKEVRKLWTPETFLEYLMCWEDQTKIRTYFKSKWFFWVWKKSLLSAKIYMLNMHSPNTMLVTKINSRDHLGKKSSCLIKREKWSILPENYFSKSKVNIKTLHLTFNKEGYKFWPLTNWFQGSYCMLQTKFFLLRFNWPKHEMPRPYIMWKMQGSVTYSTDHEKPG